IYVSAKNAGELDAYRGKLPGAIVVLQQPADLTWQSPATDSSGSPIQIPEPSPDRTKPSPEDQFNAARMAFFKEQGVTAVLRDSDKSYGLLNMTNAGNRYEPALVPIAMLTHEDYSLIWRLLQKGTVEVEVSLSNSFSQGSVEAYNIVAEIRGLERPDEVVI